MVNSRTGSTRTISWLTIALVASLGACGKKLSEYGQGSTAGKGDTDATGVCAPPKVVLVVDKSSSMVRASIASKTLWQIAEEAIGQIINTYDASMEFGLMVFPGPAVDAAGLPTDDKRKCTPGAVTVMPAASQGTQVLAQLSAPPPHSGNYTPMSQSLDTLVTLDELKQGNTHVLLITDGWQWCDGADNGAMRKTPVNSVKALKDLGISTHVIGFGASVDVETLNEMAAAAGTKINDSCDPTSASTSGDNCYYQANDPPQLLAALQSITGKIKEICDGLDNDCNNQVDEDLGDGDLCDKQDGVCKGARAVCSGTSGWTCGAEVYQVAAAANGATMTTGTYEAGDETLCDGKDNDCDGKVDENCDCVGDETAECGSEIGECGKQRGTKSCVNGKWSECVGDLKPGTNEEICDGLDNDCNNQTDEIGCQCLGGQTETCGAAVGACQQGSRTCSTTGKWGTCVNEIKPQDELCDGEDNDCNGQTDENLEPPECGNQVGVCNGALAACGGSAGWKPCTDVEYAAAALKHGATYEDDESKCDNFDNDCDGTIDEGCDCMDGQVRSCGKDQGVCQPGTQTCAGGKWPATCNGGVQDSPEVCDGLDNDCNGSIDENLTQPCNSQCGSGTQTCQAGNWSTCTARLPTAEVCDGIDNDCDGTVDGVHVICANGGVCLNGRCTPRDQPENGAVMAGGGLACELGNSDGSGAAPTGLLLLGLLLLARRRR